MHMREQWRLHCTSQWGRQILLSEHVSCVAIVFKMTEWIEQQICIKFCVKLERSSVEMSHDSKAAVIGNSWLAASSRQRACSCTMSHAEFFGQTLNRPGDSAPLLPKFMKSSNFNNNLHILPSYAQNICHITEISCISGLSILSTWRLRGHYICWHLKSTNQEKQHG